MVGLYGKVVDEMSVKASLTTKKSKGSILDVIISNGFVTEHKDRCQIGIYGRLIAKDRSS